jgi:hypothetical protein
VWGGTHPLQVLHSGDSKSTPLLVSRFGFQDVRWSPEINALVAAEQGGDLWLLAQDGRVLNRCRDAGTTAYRMQCNGTQVVVARMNRVVQRFDLGHRL